MNYKLFIHHLKRTNLFKEGLPVKTIYRRFCNIRTYANNNHYPWINTDLSKFVHDEINEPFFGYDAIEIKLVVQVVRAGEFGTKCITAFHGRANEL